MALSPSVVEVTCRVCSRTAAHPRFQAREMMFGLGDEFGYFQCETCGCLQIERVPSDLSRFYPPDYYSLSTDPETTLGQGLRARARTARDRWATLGEGLLGRLLAARWPEPALAALRIARPTRDSRILDVGCGTGLHLAALQRVGFRRLLGVDPFLPDDLFHPPSLRIRALSLHELEGGSCWDLITYQHAFEHVADPLAQLESVRRLLAPGGWCLLRVPVADSEAWERYRTDWVQLDAPRHLFLHTRASLACLAERAGLRLECVVHDSTAFQFWGSEQYRHGVPLFRQGGPPDAWARARFTRAEWRGFRREARRLNTAGRGDQAVFVLRTAGKHM